MLTFWLLAALMMVVAIAIILPTLVLGRGSGQETRRLTNLAVFDERFQALEEARRESRLSGAELETARAEIERQMLNDLQPRTEGTQTRGRGVGLALTLAMVLPLASVAMYLQFGSPQALNARPLQRSADSDAKAGDATVTAGESSGSSVAADAGTPHSVQEMVTRLAQRLRGAPDDPDGWLMLGRSYAAMNQLPQARDALMEANRRRPDDPTTLVALAEVVAGLNQNRLAGEPMELIQQALASDPNFARALWLAGLGAYRAADAATAVGYWERLLGVQGLDAGSTAQVRDAIAQAREHLGRAGVAATGATAPAQTASAEGGDAAQVTALVSIAPELAGRASPDHVVFVYARAAQGPRMPLAVQRLTVADLPRAVTLDDSMAMAPAMRLSSFPEVVLAVRVSSSGSATPTPGDLVGVSPVILNRTVQPVPLVVDRVSP